MDVKPKHIAIICNYELLENRIGGMDYFFWAFNKKCLEKDIQIDWFFPNKATHGDYNKFNIVSDKNMSLENSFISYIKYNVTNYTHVITHFIELCTSFFASIKKEINTKIIAIDHNPRPLNGYSLKKRIKKKLKGRLYGKYIDQFIGVSDYTSNTILNDFGNFLSFKTKTICNGLDIEQYDKKDIFLHRNKFLTSSHLREEKGIQDLINAVLLLPVELSNKLVIEIYGNGPIKKKLMKMVELNKLKHVISFKGSVMNLNTLYKEYDYLIHPSRGETFCYSVLEAIICNLPVITTINNGNILNLIKHNSNGFLHEEEDVVSLSNILMEILLGNKKIINVSNDVLVKKFSLEKMVENHLKLLS